MFLKNRLSSLSHAQVNTSDDFETSAKIEIFCSIQANDVNFGVVALPLTAQSANAQMRVLCTNNTPYKVDLAYGQYVPSNGGSTNDYAMNRTKPTGWVGAYNAPGLQPVGGLGYAEFGSMSGTQKSDTFAYKVTLPNDSSKTWAKGLNSYNSTGIGTEQMITINAQIVPDKSSSKYVAQDVYLDNVTAEITY